MFLLNVMMCESFKWNVSLYNIHTYNLPSVHPLRGHRGSKCNRCTWVLIKKRFRIIRLHELHPCCILFIKYFFKDGFRIYNIDPIREMAHYKESEVSKKISLFNGKSPSPHSPHHDGLGWKLETFIFIHFYTFS